EGGKLFVGALELLQAESVGLRRGQPGYEPILSGANGIDVPGGDLHGASPHARTTPNVVPQKHLSGRCVRATAFKALFSRGWPLAQRSHLDTTGRCPSAPPKGIDMRGRALIASLAGLSLAACKQTASPPAAPVGVA